MKPSTSKPDRGLLFSFCELKNQKNEVVATMMALNFVQYRDRQGQWNLRRVLISSTLIARVIEVPEQTMFIRLPAEVTKEGRKKDIPINHHVEAVLAKLPRHINHDYVFTYRTIPIQHKNGLKNSFRTACGKAGIVYGRDKKNGLIFHDLRRSTKTYMLSAKVDRTYRDLILGHTLPGMDAHYIALTDNDLTKAINKYT